jgi:protein required for attachment to host cells
MIAAAPRLLGELREDLPKALRAAVAVELAKDLVKIPTHDLPAHFDGVAVF